MIHIKEGLQGWCVNIFDQKIGSGAIATNKEVTNVNDVLTVELQKPVTSKLQRRKDCVNLNIILFFFLS